MDLNGEFEMEGEIDKVCSIRERMFLLRSARRKERQTKKSQRDKPKGASCVVGKKIMYNTLEVANELPPIEEGYNQLKLQPVGRMERLKVKITSKAGGSAPAARALTRMIITSSATLLILLLALGNTPVAEAVDCFKCSSRNGSNPACEDPFHNINTTRIISPVLPDPPPGVIYHAPCYAGKKGREGLFPASACIKLTGTFETGETLVVRHCALDSGTLTQDTELARMSHCGKFQFEGDLLKGCVLACPEDACNGSPGRRAGFASACATSALIPIIITCFLLTTASHYHYYYYKFTLAGSPGARPELSV